MTLTRIDGRATALLLALGLALGARAQTAGPKTPSALFQSGREAFNRGEFRLAADRFEAAFHIAPRGATLYNAGLAWQSAGETPRAADDFELALNMTSENAPFLADAQERLSALKKTLGYVEIDNPVGWRVTVEQLKSVSIPVRLHVSPGTHVLEFTSGHGAREQRTVTVRAAEAVTVGFLAPPEAPSPEANPLLPRTPVVDNGPRQRRTAGFVLLGVGAVFGGGAVALGQGAYEARERFYKSGLTSGKDRSQTVTLRALSNVSAGVAGGCAIASAVLLATGFKKTPAPSVSLAFGIGPGNALVKGEF